MEELYLGDGVYVKRHDNYDFVLYTSNGITVTNEIYLDPDIIEGLVRFVANASHAHRKSIQSIAVRD